MAATLVATASATFTGAEDSVTASWSSTITGSFTVTHGVEVSDSSGAVSVMLPSASLTGTSAVVQPSARFSGVVWLFAWQ